jgi:hypothetical protein
MRQPFLSCAGRSGQPGSPAPKGKWWSADRVGQGEDQRDDARDDHDGEDGGVGIQVDTVHVRSARTEVTDRMLIFGQRHLRTILAQYEAHYNGRRPHRSRQLRPPRPDHPVADLSQERIKRRPVVGGFINEYERAA